MTDEEYLEKISKVEIYCEILLGVLRHTPVRNYSNDGEFQTILNRNLKFEKNDDHLRFRACIDLTEDTQLAIEEFYKNGLETSSNQYGENYLRLYGILNAVYLQMQATIELIELFKIPNKKKIVTELNDLEIIKVRNKIGAHTPKYENKKEKVAFKYESYRLTQTSISKWADKLVLVSSYDKIEKYDLIPLIKEFTERIEFYLDVTSDKALKSLFKNESKNKRWMQFRLNFARKKTA